MCMFQQEYDAIIVVFPKENDFLYLILYFSERKKIDTALTSEVNLNPAFTIWARTQSYAGCQPEHSFWMNLIPYSYVNY